MLYIWNHCTLSFRSYSRLRNSLPRNSRDFAAQILSLTDFRAKERLLAVEIFTHTINNYWTLLSQIAIIIINCKFVFYWIFSGSEAICHFHARGEKRGFVYAFAAKHSWTTLHMSRPLLVGSYLQDTWWAFGQWKGETIGLRKILIPILQNDVDTLWFIHKAILYKGRNHIDY